MAKGKRFIIAGGGTGGHIFPAIAIAQMLKKISPDSNFLFVGAKGKMEMEKVPQAGFEIEGLTIAGFNRSSLIKNIGLPIKLIQSFIQVAQIFKNFKPDAVIGVGGYSSFPVLRFAQTKGIPTFIHESNSFAGKSNQMLGKKATKIFTATDGMDIFFPKERIIISGNPVRSSIINHKVNTDEGLHHFCLALNKKTIFSVGGSLGAQSINEAILKNLQFFENGNVQLIWQTGKSFYNQAKEACKGFENIVVKDFITQMEYAYAAADVVISRSGAMAVSELCIVGKPVFFVPFPFAAENHQMLNATKIVEKNAALVMEDKDALEKLIPEVFELLNNNELQNKLKQNISKLGVLNADEIIANQILDILK
jgi:UDP-N-acetylglucosamine--N-acetylmuramyl-(pentapeptide) pyrophosphoryl-undecaprenol N-acetylglucosamine transferase